MTGAAARTDLCSQLGSPACEHAGMSETARYAPPPPSGASSPLGHRVRTHVMIPAALAGGLVLWDPTRRGGPPLCPYRMLTGHSCPGCGLTRAFGSLLRGRWHEALVLHPLAPVLMLELVVAFVALAAFGDRLRSRVPTWALATALSVNAAALLVTWAVRSASGQIGVLG
jgi:Protein of unknown function (DUF2752)